nr:PREDICTED: uncharacterized protein LOC103999115 isoform X2 [Musa acuminata subsp. malaccensis]
MLQALLHYLKRISLEEERGRKARHENAELINVYPPPLERIKGVRQALMGKQRTVKDDRTPGWFLRLGGATKHGLSIFHWWKAVGSGGISRVSGLVGTRGSLLLNWRLISCAHSGGVVKATSPLHACFGGHVDGVSPLLEALMQHQR